ncbi:MAG: dockerin type I repeat-containing protein [Prevotella sp.]|nr:dockerin type I repeat-containing protein [Prevotella sp.]
MKTALNWTIMLLAGLLLWPAAATAQNDYNPEDMAFNQEVDPNEIFDFVDSHAYSNNMSITAVVKKDGATLSDALVAVYASDGIRGKDVADPEQGNLVFLTVYGEGSTPLVFKVYTGGQIYVVDQGLNFESNGTVGMDDPYVITLQNPVLPGDANGDGTVNAADPVAVANYIIGQPPATFVKAAADVNNDGNVTISDAVGIVSMLLN